MSQTGESIRLLQVTDPHLHAHGGSKMRGVNTYDSLLEVIASAQRDPWPPAAILATGDLVQDETKAGYQRFKRVFENLSVPVYCLPGNHDEPNIMQTVLTSPPFQYCGIAVFDKWCILLLDTYSKGVASGHLEDTALQNLEIDLGKYRNRHVLICLHHQPVPMGSRWLDGVGLDNAAEFLKIVDTHTNVKGILWGHVHQASDRRRNGVLLMSTPSTCAQFLPNSDDFALDSKPPGYRWLTLEPDGNINTHVVWLDSQ